MYTFDGTVMSMAMKPSNLTVSLVSLQNLYVYGRYESITTTNAEQSHSSRGESMRRKWTLKIILKTLVC